jgi:hypothetical protein
MADASGSTSDDVSQGGMGAGLGTDRGRRLLDDVDGVIAALQGGVEHGAARVGGAGWWRGCRRTSARSARPSCAPWRAAGARCSRRSSPSSSTGRARCSRALAAQVDDVAAQARTCVRERLQTLSALLTNAGEQLR